MLSTDVTLSTKVHQDLFKPNQQNRPFPVDTINTIESLASTRLKVSQSTSLHQQSKQAREVARELIAKSRELRERTARICRHSAAPTPNNRAKVNEKNTVIYQRDYIHRRAQPTAVFNDRFLAMKAG